MSNPLDYYTEAIEKMISGWEERRTVEAREERERSRRLSELGLILLWTLLALGLLTAAGVGVLLGVVL